MPATPSSRGGRQRRSDVDEKEMVRTFDWPPRGVTRRVVLGALAGGIGATVWNETGLGRKKHRGRKQTARVGAEAKGGEIRRPIGDFVDAQGTTSEFLPPVPDFLGWLNQLPSTRGASVDYAGLANGWLVSQGYPDLGTTTSGTVTDRPLEDGRAEVSVVLHTRNALAWAFEVPDPDTGPNFATDPLTFGYRAQDLESGHDLPPAIGDSHFGVVFKNTAPGDPLPDLIVWLTDTEGRFPDLELLSLSFRATAFGPLHPEFEGVAEGTPGRLTIVQTGVLHSGFHGAVSDGFPAERVELGVVGRTKNP
jgi:hypothetical protein